MKKNIILGSTSPRRKEILSILGIEGLDKAGGFAVQEKDNILIDHIDGDWHNLYQQYSIYYMNVKLYKNRKQ